MHGTRGEDRVFRGGRWNEVDDLVVIELVDVFLGWTDAVCKAELDGMFAV